MARMSPSMAYFLRRKKTRPGGLLSTPVVITDPPPSDTTAPTLSSATGTQTGQTTATIGVTTNEANGTLYSFVSTSATPPTATNLKAGTGAVFANSQTITTTGAKTASATGLTAATAYYVHWLHRDAAGNDSAIATSASFTTAAAGHLYDFTVGSLPAGVTASGGANATRVNSSGNLVPGSAPRFDYTSAGVSRGLLAEVAATNLILQSEAMGTTWTAAAGTIATNNTASPSGSVDAERFTEDNATGVHRIFQLFTITSGTTYTMSAYVKDGDRRYVSLAFNPQSTGAIYVAAKYDLTLGTVASTTATGAGAVYTSSGIESAGNGWYRIWLTGSLATTSAYVLLGLATDGTTFSASERGSQLYAGTSKLVYFYGAQLATGSVPTTYIPTTTAAVTRSADLITVDTPATFTTLRLTFDNDATQDFTVTPSSTYALVPASMNRPRVKFIDAV